MKLELTDVEVHLLGVAMYQLCEEGASNERSQKHREELSKKVSDFVGYMRDTDTKRAVLEVVQE